ncbi:MAG: hypothetical protein ACQESR_07630 [Planctomycetota bacterium]
MESYPSHGDGCRLLATASRPTTRFASEKGHGPTRGLPPSSWRPCPRASKKTINLDGGRRA